MKKITALLTVVAVVGVAAAQPQKDPSQVGVREFPPAPFVPSGGSPWCNQPFVAIPDSTPGGVQDTINIPGSFVLTDVNVSLNVTHTWVGDLIFTVESPSATSVTIVDRPGNPASGFGCSGNDINAVLDDEAGSSVEDECGAGTPTINGTFIPNNPLSAFDGQDALGVWTITASDNAGGDTGTLNEWCVITDPVPVELRSFSID